MLVEERWYRLAARLLVREVRVRVEEYRQDLPFAVLRLQEQGLRLATWFQLPLAGAEREHFELLWEDQP